MAQICLWDMKVPELVGYGVYLIWEKNDTELSREVCLIGWLPTYILIDFNVKQTLGWTSMETITNLSGCIFTQASLESLIVSQQIMLFFTVLRSPCNNGSLMKKIRNSNPWDFVISREGLRNILHHNSWIAVSSFTDHGLGGIMSGFSYVNSRQKDFRVQELPLARIKKIMKLDEDVKVKFLAFFFYKNINP